VCNRYRYLYVNGIIVIVKNAGIACYHTGGWVGGGDTGSLPRRAVIAQACVTLTFAYLRHVLPVDFHRLSVDPSSINGFHPGA